MGTAFSTQVSVVSGEAQVNMAELGRNSGMLFQDRFDESSLVVGGWLFRIRRRCGCGRGLWRWC